jgi:hypothetical protein
MFWPPLGLLLLPLLCLHSPAAIMALRDAVVGGPSDLLQAVKSFNGTLDPCHEADPSCSSCLSDVGTCGQLKAGATPGATGAYFCNFFGISCADSRWAMAFPYAEASSSVLNSQAWCKHKWLLLPAC